MNTIEITSVCLQIFQLHEGEGSSFELRDGVGCQVQCLQGNVRLQLMQQQFWDPIVDSESYKNNHVLVIKVLMT